MAFDNTLYCGECDAWHSPEDLVYDEKYMIYRCKKHNNPCFASKKGYERYMQRHPVLGRRRYPD